MTDLHPPPSCHRVRRHLCPPPPPCAAPSAATLPTAAALCTPSAATLPAAAALSTAVRHRRARRRRHARHRRAAPHRDRAVLHHFAAFSVSLPSPVHHRGRLVPRRRFLHHFSFFAVASAASVLFPPFSPSPGLHHLVPPSPPPLLPPVCRNSAMYGRRRWRWSPAGLPGLHRHWHWAD